MVNTLEELQKELEASGSGEFKPTDNSGVLDDDVLSQLAKATSPESIGLRLRKDESEPKSDSVVPEHKLDTTPLPVSKVPPEPKSSSVTGNDWKGIHSMLNGDSVAAPSAPVNQEAAGNVMKIPASGQFVGNTASGEPDWNKLTHDLKWAQNDAMSRRNVDHLLATVTPDGRYKMDPGSYEAEVSNARLPLEMAQARQGWQKGQNSINLDEEAKRAAAADRDPTSPQSRRAQEAFKNFFGDSKYLPSNISQLSAAELKQYTGGDILPLMKMSNAEQIVKDKANGIAKTLADDKQSTSLLYKDHPEVIPEIMAAADQAGLSRVQSALEGRFNRQGAQDHADETQARSQKFQEDQAIAASERNFKRAQDLKVFDKNYDNTHKPLTSEMEDRRQALIAAPAILKLYADAMSKVPGDTIQDKIRNFSVTALPKQAKALGIEGSDFPEFKRSVEIALTRTLEGGMARPGNVEMMHSSMPDINDAPNIRKSGTQNLQNLIDLNGHSFDKAIESGGYSGSQPISPLMKTNPETPVAKPPTKTTVPAGRSLFEEE